MWKSIVLCALTAIASSSQAPSSPYKPLAQSTIKSSAVTYVQKLTYRFNSSAELIKAKATALARHLKFDYETSKQMSHSQNLENLLDSNSQGFQQNCTPDLFWAINGVKFSLDSWYDTCANYDKSLADMRYYIDQVHMEIDANKASVAQAIDYVANCTDNSTAGDCVQEGTMNFLQVLEEEKHALQVNPQKGFYFYSELSTALISCVSEVTHLVQNDLSRYMVQYCIYTPPTTDYPFLAEA